jgi:hypothetical protein
MQLTRRQALAGAALLPAAVVTEAGETTAAVVSQPTSAFRPPVRFAVSTYSYWHLRGEN